MSRLARIFQIKHFLLYNAIVWIFFAGISLLSQLALFVAYGISFDNIHLIHFPLSTFLTFWILSHFTFDIYLATRQMPPKWFWTINICVSLLFGVVHKTLSYTIGLLLERLFLIQETKTWRELIELWQQTWFDIFWGAAVYLLIISVLIALDLWHRYRDERLITLQLQNRLTDTQLSSLKLQMQPHFLFNALNTIAMMVRKNNRDEAVSMIASLSDMLRNSLSSKKQTFLTLKEELLIIDQYLAIEKSRYQDRLTVNHNIQPDALEVKVPNLILQPIVENAFKHGISQSLESARLDISARVENDKLLMEVFNTGNQLPEGWHSDRKQGIGLGNTVRRLMQLYQGNFKFQITEKEDGVLVRIVIPQTLP